MDKPGAAKLRAAIKKIKNFFIGTIFLYQAFVLQYKNVLLHEQTWGSQDKVSQ